MYPFRRWSEDFLYSIFKTNNRSIKQKQAVPAANTIRTQPSMGAGWGAGGGRLKVGLPMPDPHCSTERLCGQRIPQPLSLVRFLCGYKK